MDGTTNVRSRRVRSRWVLSVLIALTFVLSAVPFASANNYVTHPYIPVSVSVTGAFPNSGVDRPGVSADGRYVVFQSDSSNLTPDSGPEGDDGDQDVYLRDRMNGTTLNLSGPRVGADENDRGANWPSISDDGRYVCFVTGQDLVASDTNGDPDVYIYDTADKTYTQLHVGGDVDDTIDNDWDRFKISGNGKFIVFQAYEQLFSAENNGSTVDVYVHDIAADTTELISTPRAGASYDNHGSRSAEISDDGRYVSFFSGQDFVASDTNNSGSNDGQDLYIFDRQTDTFTRADVIGDGATEVGPDAMQFDMSGDGSYVAFAVENDVMPGDTNGVTDVILYDVAADDAMIVSEPRAGATDPNRGSRHPRLSDDGSAMILFSGQDFVPEDTNGHPDFYRYDVDTGEWTWLPYPENDDNYDDVWEIDISGDGNWIVFEDETSNLLAYAPTDDDCVFIRNANPPFEDGAARIAGANRYATAIAASQQAFPMGSQTVVIATGANWPDALGGSALAGAANAPILLTTPTSLPDSVKAEIMRLGATRGYILGGTGAVSAEVENVLNAMLTGPVKRLGGVDRYATSQLVANQAMNLMSTSYEGTACVATGRNYADAMAAAPVASGLGWPILLANPTEGTVDLPSRVQAAVVLGGVGAVPAATMTDAETKLGAANVLRLGGATRYNTAAMIAEHGVEHGLAWNGVGIARGDAFPDALAGGAGLGLQQTVMLLTPTNSLAAAAQTALDDNKADIMSVNFLGGTGAVSAAVEAQIKTLLGM